MTDDTTESRRCWQLGLEREIAEEKAGKLVVRDWVDGRLVEPDEADLNELRKRVREYLVTWLGHRNTIFPPSSRANCCDNCYRKYCGHFFDDDIVSEVVTEWIRERHDDINSFVTPLVASVKASRHVIQGRYQVPDDLELVVTRIVRDRINRGGRPNTKSEVRERGEEAVEYCRAFLNLPPVPYQFVTPSCVVC